MAGEVRTILDELDVASLRQLCELRSLPVGGNADDKRSRLARSFRGHLEELLPHLRRDEMIRILDDYYFYIDDGRRGEFVGLTNASWDELQRAMKKLFVDDWEPASGRLQPLGPAATIRIKWGEDPDANEEEDDDDEEDESDDDEGEEDAVEGNDSKQVEGWADDPEVDLIREFYEWLSDFLAERGASTLLVKTLVNRLGRHRADARLRTSAVHDLAQVLAQGGFSTDPDLGRMDVSPGIEARVRITRRAQVTRVPPSEWLPVPKAPTDLMHGAQPAPAPLPPALSSDFERAAAKLKFLATVSASIARPVESSRFQAVEHACRDLSVSAADKVRLRALAHQYSAGNEDLRVTVRQLRVTLSEHERRALLIQLRELAPATTELEELIQIYSTDLGISVGLAAPPPVVQDAVVVDPSPLDALAAAGGVRENPSLDQVFEPATAPQQAGGVRENAALDDIFSKGGNE